MANPLTTTSILLHLEIRKWAGEVSDKKALKAVADQFHSDTHNDKYKKSLFVSDPLALIDRCAGRIRNHFYACTVPWLDNGKGRLIPSLNFQDFARKHTALVMDFDNEVHTFIEKYPEHKDQAEEKKGDLYNEAEYPAKSVLQQRFAINLTTLPFPNIDDFRVDAPNEVIVELEASMKESVERVQSVVSDELEDRFRQRLAMLKKTILHGKRFNKSLLTELAAVIDMANNLHETVTNRLISDMAKVEVSILKYPSIQIRNSESVQTEVVEVIDNILSKP